MGVFVLAALYGLSALGIGSRLLLCAIPIAVGAAVYIFAVIRLKAVTRQDCLLLPKGEKIAKIMKL